MGSMSVFCCLREVPSGWPLEAVIDAWVHLTGRRWQVAVHQGKAALVSRLEELWAEEGQEWLAGRALSEGTREAQLAEALLQHGLAEARGCLVTHFTPEGLLRESGYVPLNVRAVFDEIWLRQGCRELAGRLAAAEARAETAKRRRLEEISAELQAAKEASAGRQELCEQLTARVAELAAAASDKDAELQAVQEERGRLASHLEEVQAEVRALQSERAKREEQCQQLEAQVHAAEAAASDQAAQRLAQDQPRNEGDLQSLLIENAVYKDRCEQLRQQLAKAEAEESANARQIQALAEQKGLYMGRCNQLEQLLSEAKKATFPLSVGPQLDPRDERSSICSEESWVHLSDPGSVGPLTQSSTSGISVDTSGPHCFMMDATFKAESGVMVSAEDLEEGSKILAADGRVVQVASPPKQHQANKTVLLQAGAATLQVTLDHRVVLPDKSTVEASRLRVGQEVMVQGIPTKLTSVDVLLEPVTVWAISFQPDLPVEVFKPSIQSHGHRLKRARRGHRRTRSAGSIPRTEGDYAD